jgi:hypothetical protein
LCLETRTALFEDVKAQLHSSVAPKTPAGETSLKQLWEGEHEAVLQKVEKKIRYYGDLWLASDAKKGFELLKKNSMYVHLMRSVTD